MDGLSWNSAPSRRAVLAAGAAAGVGLALGAPAAALARPPALTGPGGAGLGVSANSAIYWESAEQQRRSLDFIRDLGVGSVRVDLPWRWIQPERETWQWWFLDAVVDGIRSRGMTVLGVLTSTPRWAALGGSENQQTRPGSLPAWTGFVERTAERYAGRIAAYEVWNEPNARDYFAPDPNPEAYAEMVRAALPAIRGKDPAALAVVGALGPASDAEGLIPALPFFERMLAAGVGEPDAYSFHPYDFEQTLAEAAHWDGTAARQVTRMHEMLRERGQGDRPIWATEYGAPTWLGAARQAELIDTGIAQWSEYGFAGPLYLHEHRDPDGGDGFGLEDAAGAPKEAAGRVRRHATQGIVRRPVALDFELNADPALGMATSPVYRVADGSAQDHDDGVRFGRAGRWFSSPPAVGRLFRHADRLPAGPYADGMQDMDAGGSARIFTGPSGTWMVLGGFLDAWTPELGFPVADQRLIDADTTEQRFERGALRWNRYTGITGGPGS